MKKLTKYILIAFVSGILFGGASNVYAAPWSIGPFTGDLYPLVASTCNYCGCAKIVFDENKSHAPTCESGGNSQFHCECNLAEEHGANSDEVRNKPTAICGQIGEAIFTPLGHNIGGDWYVYKAATCTTGGSKFQKCLRCEVPAAPIPTDPLGHDPEGWPHDSDGHWKKCTRCSYTCDYGSHNMTGWYPDGDGQHKKHCTTCGYSITAGHDYTNYQSVNESNHKRYCPTCDYTSTENHHYTDWANGGDHHSRYCTLCDHPQSHPNHDGSWTSGTLTDSDGRTVTYGGYVGGSVKEVCTGGYYVYTCGGHGAHGDTPSTGGCGYQWSKPITYTMTFDLNLGTGPSPVINAIYDLGYTLPDAPVRDGYEFAGWQIYESAERSNHDTNPMTSGAALYPAGSVVSNLTATPDTNVTWVAIWHHAHPAPVVNQNLHLDLSDPAFSKYVHYTENMPIAGNYGYYINTNQITNIEFSTQWIFPAEKSPAAGNEQDQSCLDEMIE